MIGRESTKGSYNTLEDLLQFLLMYTAITFEFEEDEEIKSQSSGKMNLNRNLQAEESKFLVIGVKSN